MDNRLNRPLGSIYYKQVTTSGAPTSKCYYDAAGREFRTGTTGFDGILVYTCTVYNNKGQVSEVSLPHILGNTSLKKVYFYDRYGRKIREESTTGIVTYNYSGKTVQVTNSAGQTSSKTTDSQGNIVNATDDAGSVDYTYKSNGKPASITSAGSTWSMTYDNLGRQTSLTDPNAGSIAYRYNNYNELTRQTDARGKIDSLTYDVLGRVATEVRDEGTKVYTYDPSGNPGLLDSVTYSGGSVKYNYDSASRLTGRVSRINGTGNSTGYGYDSYSRLQTYTYPSGFAIKNVYNTSGYLSEVRRNDNNALIWQGQNVNVFGEFTQYTYGNNLVTTKTYDCLGMLRKISTGSIQNMDYSYDYTSGNMISRKDNLQNLLEIFTYDNLNRLTGVSGPATLTMSYSSNGNILSKTSAGDYSYDGSKPHTVTSVTNPDGLIPTTTQRVTYTSFNKVDSIIQSNLVYSLNYGAENQRTISRLYDNGTIQKTVYYDGDYEKEVKPGNNIRQIHYIAGGDGLAAIFVKNNGQDTLYYIHTDYLGSINVITNQSGAVIKNYSFDAWGRRRNPVNWTYNNVPTSFLFSRGFTGHEHLDQFGLINMNGRVYDPILARMLSPDNFIQAPDFTQSFNSYSYCLNNPLIYTDPTGYSWDDVPEGHLLDIVNHRNYDCDGSGGFYNGVGGYGGGYGYAEGGYGNMGFFDTGGNTCDVFEAIDHLCSPRCENGGYWSCTSGIIHEFENNAEAFVFGGLTNQLYGYWGCIEGAAKSWSEAISNYRMNYKYASVGKLEETELTICLNSLKQYFAIVAGETGTGEGEAAGIGSVIMNILRLKCWSVFDLNFTSEIGGKIYFNAIKGDIYNEIMSDSWDKIFSYDYIYSSRIRGAGIALISGKDYSNGAYFFNAMDQLIHPLRYDGIGANWQAFLYDGVFDMTTQIGGTAFFKYHNIYKHWR